MEMQAVILHQKEIEGAVVVPPAPVEVVEVHQQLEQLDPEIVVEMVGMEVLHQSQDRQLHMLEVVEQLDIQVEQMELEDLVVVDRVNIVVDLEIRG